MRRSWLQVRTGVIPALKKLGVLPELVLDSGNCSIAAYRLLWADTTHSVKQMTDLAVSLGVAGFAI